MAQVGHYYEAVCGQCDKFLYGTTTGDFIPRVVCPMCGAANLFSDSTGLSKTRIQGTLEVDVSRDIGRRHAAPSAGLKS